MRIYVECKPDFTLVTSITRIFKRHIIHVGGKSEMCKRLEKQQHCTGLIDEDPWSIQPSYIEKTEIVNDFPEYGIKVLHDKSKDNYLFVLCPRLEEWILKTAKDVHIDVKKYGLPDDPLKLHEKINANLDKCEKLLKSLDESKRLKTLKTLLEKKR